MDMTDEGTLSQSSYRTGLGGGYATIQRVLEWGWTRVSYNRGIVVLPDSLVRYKMVASGAAYGIVEVP